MAGFLLMFWGCPHMTHARLLFNIMSTSYCVGASILLEEKRLYAELGKDYDDYLHTVPRFCPFLPAAKTQKDKSG